MTPGAHQKRPDHDQRHIEDREAEGERHMVPDAELQIQLLSAHEQNAPIAHMVMIAATAFLQRCQRKSIGQVRRRNTDRQRSRSALSPPHK